MLRDTFRFMRTSPPPLLPIFRSRAQAEVLSEIFLHAGREYSLTELAMLTAVSLSTVHREVGQLVAAGLLSEHRIGNVRRVVANEGSRFYSGLRQILERAFGPEPRLREALAQLPQVRQAWLFGSYAQRLAGVAGAAPHDIDVAVVVDGDATAVYEVCARVSADLHVEVNATVFTAAEWDDNGDIFVRQLREGILVDLVADELPAAAPVAGSQR